jgi:hypothetical protein
MDNEQIIKIPGGYSKECSFMTLEWDDTGKYRGQWQDDMLSDEPGRIFINASPHGAQVEDLTKEQMDAAQR